MRPAPARALVTASASPNPQIAVAAQSLINHRLQSYGEQIRGNRRLAEIGDDFVAFALALAELQKSNTGNYGWIRQTAHRIVWLANKMPSGATPSLAAICDTILSSPAGPGVGGAPLSTLATKSALSERSEPSGPRSDLSIALPDLRESFQRQPRASNHVAAGAPIVPLTTPDPGLPPAPSQSIPTPPPNQITPSNRALWRPPRPVNDDTSAAPLSLRILPDPSAGQPIAENNAAAQPRQQLSGAANADPSLADMPARELLSSWRTATAKDAGVLEIELARRGFGILSRPMVEQFLSPDASGRSKLVETVQAQPGASARPWLLLLAADRSADVRLAAVTVMATSNDPQLIEQAFQAAIHDRDPRIAALAAHLAQRRGELRK